MKKTLIFFFIGWSFSFVETLMGAFVLLKFWSWFVIPFSSAPALNYPLAIGLMLIFDVLNVDRIKSSIRLSAKIDELRKEEDKSDFEDLGWSIGSALFLWPTLLFFGWVWHCILG